MNTMTGRQNGQATFEPKVNAPKPPAGPPSRKVMIALMVMTVVLSLGGAAIIGSASAGPRGPGGVTGTQGVPGVQGAPGSDGATGRTGPKGPRGATAPVGSTGVTASGGGGSSTSGATTIPGDGTFLVGTDIQAGTYHADASPSGNCYWERDSDLNGNLNSIISNDNSSGPVVVQIGSSDAAFNDSGCGTFTKTG
jgi:hypothetical protein